jgi:hypothetical protein
VGTLEEFPYAIAVLELCAPTELKNIASVRVMSGLVHVEPEEELLTPFRKR